MPNEFDELRMRAEQLHRSLPDDIRAKINIDDLYLAIRSPSERGIEQAKRTKVTTAILGLAAGLLGFLIGASFGAVGAWIGGGIAAFAGWSLSERYFANKVGEEVKREIDEAVASLIGTASN